MVYHAIPRGDIVKVPIEMLVMHIGFKLCSVKHLSGFMILRSKICKGTSEMSEFVIMLPKP